MRNLARILTALIGGALAALGIVLGAMWLVWPLLNRENLLSGATLLLGLAALCLLYGLLTISRAFAAGEGRGWWPAPWLVFVVWAIVLGLGALAGSEEPAALAAWTLPVLYVLGVGLPVLAILAYGMRRTDTTVGRVAHQLVFGGVIAFGVSLLVQLGLLLTLGALTLAVNGSALDLRAWLTAVLRGDLGALGDLGAAPLLLTTVFLARVVIAPVVEEAAKALSLPAWGGWQPTRERAMVWGLAAGLGFALTQGLLTSTSAVTEGTWWPTMIGQAGTALVQGVTTALVGLGWWRARESGASWRLLGAYVAAVVAHAFWNLTGLARTLVAHVPMGTVTTTEPAYNVLFGDVVGILGALLLLAVLAGVLIRATSRSRWAEAG